MTNTNGFSRSSAVKKWTGPTDRQFASKSTTSQHNSLRDIALTGVAYVISSPLIAMILLIAAIAWLLALLLRPFSRKPPTANELRFNESGESLPSFSSLYVQSDLDLYCADPLPSNDYC